jgi:hypothetical protein
VGNFAQLKRGFPCSVRSAAVSLALLVCFGARTSPVAAQESPELQKFFQQSIGLSPDQIAAIRSGQPVVEALPSRTPAEVFLFGAIYIHAAPESYVRFARDFDRLRQLPNYEALGVISDPPQLSDFKGFSFNADDLKELKNCKPADCLIQMPANSIEALKQSVDWSAPGAADRVNQLLRAAALQRLQAYESQGNSALGIYNDKGDPTDVAAQFAYMLSYSKALPANLPEFYRYLLAYPDAKPANVENTFYWSRVKFGLKSTLRVVQMLTMQGKPSDAVAYAIAEKQLYSSHYFETALDLSFCVRANDSAKPGFYLIMAMGSEQAGLTGAKGSIVRKVAVGRSVSNLRDALTTVRNTLETAQ